MVTKEKLMHLLEGLNERDQRAAYEFIKFLAHRNAPKSEDGDVVNIHGKSYYVVPD